MNERQAGNESEEPVCELRCTAWSKTGKSAGKHMEKKRRDWGRRIGIAAVLTAILLAGMFYARGKFDSESAGAMPQRSKSEGIYQAQALEMHVERGAQEERQTEGAKPEEDVFNVLFLGTDQRLEGTQDRGRADVTMLCSLNRKSGAIKLVSFERGIYVPIPDRGGDLLTHAYAWGGPELSVSLIENLFHVEINGYAQVDFESFAEIVDLLGGIDVELTEQEAIGVSGMVAEKDPNGDALSAGWNHLDGKHALAYCRLRYFDDDWMRQQRQRNTLNACKQSLAGLNATEAGEFLWGVAAMVNTDLELEDISELLLESSTFVNGEVETMQVPDKNRQLNSISCDFEYESKKISNFLYGTNYEIESPYVNIWS